MGRGERGARGCRFWRDGFESEGAWTCGVKMGGIEMGGHEGGGYDSGRALVRMSGAVCISRSLRCGRLHEGPVYVLGFSCIH